MYKTCNVIEKTGFFLMNWWYKNNNIFQVTLSVMLLITFSDFAKLSKPRE